MDVTKLRSEGQLLLHEALEAVTPSAEDRETLLGYGQEVYMAMRAAAAATTPEEKAAAVKLAEGYVDAISLVVARYDVKAVGARDKLVTGMLTTGLKLAIAALA